MGWEWGCVRSGEAGVEMTREWGGRHMGGKEEARGDHAYAHVRVVGVICERMRTRRRVGVRLRVRVRAIGRRACTCTAGACALTA